MQPFLSALLEFLLNIVVSSMLHEAEVVVLTVFLFLFLASSFVQYDFIVKMLVKSELEMLVGCFPGMT